MPCIKEMMTMMKMIMHYYYYYYYYYYYSLRNSAIYHKAFSLTHSKTHVNCSCTWIQLSSNNIHLPKWWSDMCLVILTTESEPSSDEARFQCLQERHVSNLNMEYYEWNA